MKGSLRMGSTSGWKHLACYKRPPLTRPGMPSSASKIEGFGDLDPKGQAQLEAWLKGGDALKRLLSGSAWQGSVGVAPVAKPSKLQFEATAVATAREKLAAQLAAETAEGLPFEGAPSAAAAAPSVASAAAPSASTATGWAEALASAKAASAIAVELSDDEEYEYMHSAQVESDDDDWIPPDSINDLAPVPVSKQHSEVDSRTDVPAASASATASTIAVDLDSDDEDDALLQAAISRSLE